MTDLNFEWFTTSWREREVSVLLPMGTARYARMTFYGSGGAGAGGASDVDGHLEFGETVEVSADFIRRVVLDLDEGAVKVSRVEVPGAFFTINSSLDAFVTSVAAYEVWHRRLLDAGNHPQFEALTETAIDLLVQLDHAAGTRTDAWWPTRLAAVGRLV